MDARTLQEVMGNPNVSLAEYERLLPGMEEAMIAADINTPERAAMWCAQIGHESVGLDAMEEYASGAGYEWRKDLGNIYAGDGVRFKGSGPIQLTGRNNFRAFTKWCRDKGLSTIDFEAAPHLVREVPKWGFLAATYFWNSRPQLNRYADQKDLLRASAVINGWYDDGTGQNRPRKANGWDDRLRRYNKAMSMGARLLPGKAAPIVVTHPMGEPNKVWSVSSGFGPRWGTHHNGLDFAAPLGTPIYAVADGVVIQGKDRPAGSVGGFGNWVWIDHQASLGVDTIYGHMQHHTILVKQGDRVKAGQKIAEVGSEGGSTGPHLHFEVWSAPGRIGGRALDPAPWLEANVKNSEAAVAAESEEGIFMSLSNERQEDLARKIDEIHHQVVHRFDSRYDLDRLGREEITAEEVHDETLVGYMLEVDRKIEDMHANMLPALAKSILNFLNPKKKG